jgi:tetratricopeptide (TPR) repeat protein/transcriptional regulator with XRE-family HTH domain
VAEPPATFASLLKRLRTDAGLTQEQLAEVAGLSPRAVSDLERGINLTARKQTARLLADGLGLSGAVRAEFEIAARGRAIAAAAGGSETAASLPPAAGLASAPGSAPTAGLSLAAGATRTLPRDIASFTGRQLELSQLVGTTTPGGPVGPGGVVGIHAIGGMAGIGKTAFAIHAAHQLAPRFPAGQIFLPLHGHTLGHRPVDPSDALASLLLTSGVPAAQIPPTLEARMALWRDRLADKQLLLVLDDAASSEQVRPLLPGAGGSLVLVTSRRHLTALEDARAISLDTLSSDQAAGLLVRLAARPGLSGEDAEVADIARLCGYLPLAVGMIARQLHHHPAWTAADLAEELAAARLTDLGIAQRLTGDYPAAVASLSRALELHRGLGDELGEARALTDLGVVQAGVAEFAAATASLTRALHLYRSLSNRNGQVNALNYLGGVQRETGNYLASAASHEEALELSRNLGNRHGEANTLTSLGAVQSLRGDHRSAIASMEQALELYRGLGNVRGEAVALGYLGTAQQETHDYTAAGLSLSRALELFGGLGDQAAEAEILNIMGELALASAEVAEARVRHEKALAIAADVGSALDEARALEGIGRCQLRDGRTDQAAELLRRALTIYRQTGSQYASRVESLLRDQELGDE